MAFLKTVETANGERNYIGGVVSWVHDDPDCCDGRVVDFGMTNYYWDEEQQDVCKQYINLAAWNSRDPEKSQFADMVREVGLESGMLVICAAFELEPDEPAEDGTEVLKGNIYKIKTEGRIRVPAKKREDEMNLILGTVERTYADGDRCTVSLMTNSGGGRSLNYNVTFSNGEYSDTADQVRDRIEEGTLCAALCGTLKRFKGSNDLWGRRFALPYEFEEEAA